VRQISTKKRYQMLMKSWRRMRRVADQKQPKLRRRLLEELRALEAHSEI
jgi:hypothetical protein